ncbi:unnamed protein product [Microthlaspi erraticum]|uniref:RNA methyltransferase n=1 Tax=Microthlaspi erraticum TaxID=1685480 RepID=A0A6D2I3N3_9BRAS|nr:unnamed protein product [Microthlaspi erraticum]
MGGENDQNENKKKRNRNSVESIEKVVTNQQGQQGNGNPSKKKKKSQEVFPFGNYRNYYGYRVTHDMDEDPRLKVMKREWFAGKDCLDIGCNSGIMTIHIAKKFGCSSILGIDIDSSRIEDAYWHLRKFDRTENSGKRSKKKFSPRDLSQIVSFQKENFVQTRHLEDNCYDTILCLSVTKWVHLNWGDDGLITLFSKIWQLLTPGGIFVMEPQPWKSYENNRRVSETTAMHYRNIVLRPERFQEILLDKIGFRTVEDLTSSLSGASKGFDRQILAFQK